VEGDGGRFRRQHLVPVPVVDSLAELNARLTAADADEDARRIDSRAQTVGAAFAVEAPLLLPLPAERFDTALGLTARVDRYARIMVRQCQYSVPARLIGQRVRVALSASQLEVFDGSRRVATHPRLIARGECRLDLDHYLEILLGKPGALPGSTALAQARAAGAFTSTHEAFWAAARHRHGDANGTRALIEVLLLHRRLPATAVLAGITAALTAGSVSADVVAIEARKHATISCNTSCATSDGPASTPTDRTGTGTDTTATAATAAATGTESAGSAPPVRRSRAALVTLGARQRAASVAGLPADARPAPSVADYDQLLTRRPEQARDGKTTAEGSR
jgi:hypothetical protein